MSYKLHFEALQAVAGLITLVLVVVGWGLPRLSLVAAVLTLWIAGYAPLHFLAAHRFRSLLQEVMADVLERRARPRAQAASASASPQQPE